MGIQHHALDAEQIGRRHRELAQAHAEQQAGQTGIAGHLAADRYRHAGLVCGLDRMPDQVQHRRMGRIVQMADRIVVAVDGQRVLDQVVGADREEVHVLGQHVDRQCRGRHLDHCADLHVRIVGLAGRVEFLARQRQLGHGLAQFGDRIDHREQDAYPAMHRCAQDRTQLGAEQRRFGQAQADAAQAQRRVVGGGVLRPFRVLVGAEIECADGQRLAVQAGGDFAIGIELFVLGRQVVAAEEQEFAAEQADADRAGVQYVIDVLRQFDIGDQFDRRAVLCLRIGLLDAGQLAFRHPPRAQATAVFGQHHVVRRHDDHALDAVDNDQLILVDQLAGSMGGDDRRQVQAAGENGGMAGGAADFGHEGGVVGILEIDHVGRRQIVCDQDRIVDQVIGLRQFAIGAGQVLVDAFDDLHHVLLALAQVGFLDLVELLDQRIGLLFQCPFGIALLALDDHARLA